MTHSFLHSFLSEKALNFFNTLIEEREVDTVTYNTMIAAFSKDMKLKEAFDLISEMEERGLEADRFTYSSVITTLMEDGKLSEAEEFLEKVYRKIGSVKLSLQGEREKNPTKSELKAGPALWGGERGLGPRSMSNFGNFLKEKGTFKKLSLTKRAQKI